MSLVVKNLGRVDYASTWGAMRELTDTRTPDSPQELWLLEHEPVFTQGQAGKPEHVLNPGDIPVVQADRGGQVTYHGPGQLVGYCLFDLKRLNLGPRALVEGVEDALVAVLQALNIPAEANREAHGVYIAGKKIASIGLRIRRGCSYHGFALNVNMDIEPFSRINPCGYAGMEMTQIRDFLGEKTPSQDALGALLEQALRRQFPL